jgi:hypothetical protein
MQAWRSHMTRHGRSILPGETWARILFIILFILAAVLRFWDLPNIPYTHDEISALVRLYPTLYDTMKLGAQVHVDAHPQGVQVFEWFWTRFFGMSEGAVKLPFILMGLAAIFLLYRTAILWTSAQTAVMVTALMATLQYTVMYSQIARPYAAGLFTTALLADQLTRYLAFGGRTYLRGMLLGVFLSAYVHHFALLLTGLMMATAMILVRPEQRKGFWFISGLAALLYLPNIPLLLRQLSLGGLTGWLQPPDRFWPGDYMMYISHWSLPFAILLGGTVIVSLVLWVKRGSLKGPAVPVLALWGLLPLLVGYAYSVFRAPVLQYSVVLFSFPFLLMLVFIGLKHVPRHAAIAMVILVAATSVITLITTRGHYSIFYASKYEEMIRTGVRELEEHGQEKVEVLIDAPDEVIRFYLERWSIPTHRFPYVQLRNTMSAGHLDQRLRSLAGRRIVYGQTSGAVPENLARIQMHFPHLLSRTDLADGEIYVFSDREEDAAAHIEDRRLIAVAMPGNMAGPWDLDPGLPMHENGMQYWNMDGREFGLAFTARTDTLVDDREDQLEVVARVFVNAPARDAYVVAHLFIGAQPVFYRAGDLNDLLLMDGPGDLLVAARPAHGHTRRNDLIFKTYMYNQGLGSVGVRRMEVWLRRANPLQYALIGPVRRRS